MHWSAWKILLCIAIAAESISARAGESGKSSGKSGPNSWELRLGVEGSYIYNGQFWVKGRKDDEHYTFSGWSGAATLQSLATINGVSVPTGLMYWRDELLNRYKERTADGDQANELVTTEGLGLMAAGYSDIGVTGLMMLGLERAHLRHTGDTPVEQDYPYGIATKIGFGWGAVFPHGAIVLRVDYNYKYFPSVRSGDSTLYPANYQAFMPTLSCSVKF